MPQEQLVGRVRAIARIDLAPGHRQPALARVALAIAASIVGSLLADEVLVKICTALFPATKGFSHFRLSDYGVLTVVGVVAAGAGWPVVTRLTSCPRWLFLRLAVLVTVILWLPDGWILLKGEPARAVWALMVMHLAIALITYNLLVHLAPVGTGTSASAAADGGAAVAWAENAAAAPSRGRQSPPGDPGAGPASPPNPAAPLGPAAPPSPAAPLGPAAPSSPADSPASPRRLFLAMAVGTGLEFVLGIAGLIVVPLGRPSGWIPARGEALYLAHAVVGAALAVGGLLLLVRAAHAERSVRIGARMGAAGLALGLIGGILAAYHAGRVGGLALMLVGAMVAACGYVLPVVT